MKNTIAIVAKFHGATANKGDRISLTIPYWDKRIFISWDYKHAYTKDRVEAWAKRNNITIESYAEIKDAYVFLVDFEQVDQVKKAFKISE